MAAALAADRHSTSGRTAAAAGGAAGLRLCRASSTRLRIGATHAQGIDRERPPGAAPGLRRDHWGNRAEIDFRIGRFDMQSRRNGLILQRSIASIRLAMPAAASRCPMLDFTRPPGEQVRYSVRVPPHRPATAPGIPPHPPGPCRCHAPRSGSRLPGRSRPSPGLVHGAGLPVWPQRRPIAGLAPAVIATAVPRITA